SRARSTIKPATIACATSPSRSHSSGPSGCSACPSRLRVHYRSVVCGRSRHMRDRNGALRTSRWLTTAAVIAVMMANGCSGAGSDQANAGAAGAEKAATKPLYGAFGVDLTARKASVKPGDDFYMHVNGSWVDTFTIPPDKSSYSLFTKLDDEARANVRKI